MTDPPKTDLSFLKKAAIAVEKEKITEWKEEEKES